MDVDDPVPRPREVRVRVTHCGINRADIEFSRGTYGGRSRQQTRFGGSDDAAFPHALGIEPAGVVDSVGSGVAKDIVGASVAVVSHFSCQRCDVCTRGKTHLCRMATILGTGTQDRGGLDELLCVPVENVVGLPDDVSALQGACVSVGYATIYALLVQQLKLHQGQTVLVKGATGPVGLAALDIAQALGAETVAATRSVRKARLLEEELGTRSCVMHPEDSTPILEYAPEGFDIVIEPFGGNSFVDSLGAATPGGCIALVGAHVDVSANVDMSVIIAKSLRIQSTARAPSWTEAEVLRGIAAGQLSPLIGPVFRLCDVEEAFSAHEDASHLGKVVVEVAD